MRTFLPHLISINIKNIKNPVTYEFIAYIVSWSGSEKRHAWGSSTDLLSPCSHPSSLNGNVWFVGWRSSAKADVSPIFGEKVVCATASHDLIHLTAMLPAERQLLSDCGDFHNRVCRAMAISTAKSHSDVGLLQTLCFCARLLAGWGQEDASTDIVRCLSHRGRKNVLSRPLKKLSGFISTNIAAVPYR